MHSSGIVYIATLETKYFSEALISADSVKQFCPDLPITLFTDRPKHPICQASCFDTVIEAPQISGFDSTWARGQLSRIRCLTCTPYQYTLHIDTDTRVVSNELPRLFRTLDEFDVGMVETATDDSYCRIQYGRRMFNGGLVLYRRNTLVWDWLEKWYILSERNFHLANNNPPPLLPGMDHLTDETVRAKLLGMDQISLVQILSPEINILGLKLTILDYSWNYRGSELIENNREPARILHARERIRDHRANFEAAMARRLPENLMFVG